MTPSLPRKERIISIISRPIQPIRTNADFRSRSLRWSIGRRSRLSTLALWQIARMPIDGKKECVSRSCSWLVSVRSLDHKRIAIRR